MDLKFWIFILIICLSLLLYLGAMFNVCRARLRYGIKLPATTGHEGFERAFRAQQNTLEQLVVFIPSFLLFSSMLGSAPSSSVMSWIAPAIGLTWLISRLLYLIFYTQGNDLRLPCFVIGLVCNVGMVLGVIVIVILQLLSTIT